MKKLMLTANAEATTNDEANKNSILAAMQSLKTAFSTQLQEVIYSN